MNAGAESGDNKSQACAPSLIGTCNKRTKSLNKEVVCCVWDLQDACTEKNKRKCKKINKANQEFNRFLFNIKQNLFTTLSL